MIVCTTSLVVAPKWRTSSSAPSPNISPVRDEQAASAGRAASSNAVATAKASGDRASAEERHRLAVPAIAMRPGEEAGAAREAADQRGQHCRKREAPEQREQWW